MPHSRFLWKILITHLERYLGYVRDSAQSYKVFLITDFASDFADDNPNVRVVGTDLSPIQPGWIPPNLQL